MCREAFKQESNWKSKESNLAPGEKSDRQDDQGIVGRVMRLPEAGGEAPRATAKGSGSRLLQAEAIPK